MKFWVHTTYLAKKLSFLLLKGKVHVASGHLWSTALLSLMIIENSMNNQMDH